MTKPALSPSLWSWQLRHLQIEALWTGLLGALFLVGLRHIIDPGALVYRAGQLGTWALLPPVLGALGLLLWWRKQPTQPLEPAAHAPGWLLGLWGLTNAGIVALTPRVGVSVFWVLPASSLVLVTLVSMRPLRHPWAVWLHLLPGWVVVGLVAALTFPGPEADMATRYVWPREMGFNALVLMLLGITASQLQLAQRHVQSGQSGQSDEPGDSAQHALAVFRRHRQRVYAVSLGLAVAVYGAIRAVLNQIYHAPTVSSWIELALVMGLAAVLGRLLWTGRGVGFAQRVMSVLAMLAIVLYLIKPMPGYSGILVLTLMGVVAGHGPWRWHVLVWVTVLNFVRVYQLGDVPSLLAALLLPLVGSAALRLQAMVDAYEQGLSAPSAETSAGTSALPTSHPALTLPPAAKRSALTWAAITCAVFVGVALGVNWELNPLTSGSTWAADTLAVLPLVLLLGLALATLAYRSRLGFLATELAQDVAHQREALALRSQIEAAHQQALQARTQTQALLDRAQADDRAQSVFVASMSHQIRTPIQSLLGLADVMSHETLTLAQHNSVAAAKRSTLALTHILNDVVDMTRLQHGELALHPQATALAPLFEDAVALMRPNAKAKGLALDLQWDSHLPTHAELDGDRLRQVLLNLLGNAIKFTLSGSVQLTVSLTHPTHAPTTPHLRVAVSDTGIGMPQSFLLHIAQPFAQADGTITRRFGGTGLGLSISQHLVRLMGGTALQVTSQEHHGSTFAFELPLVTVDVALDVAVTQPMFSQSSPASSAPTAMPDQTSLDAQQPFKGQRLMVVDDNATNLEVAALLLEQMGAEVHLATSGADLMEALEQHPIDYDAVLMDLYMSKIDGLACTRLLRENPRWAKLPVVIISASADPEEKVKAAAAGAVAFLTKPFDRTEVLRTWAQLKASRP